MHVVDGGTGYATVGNNPTATHKLTIDGVDVMFTRSVGSNIFPYKCTQNNDGGLQKVYFDDGADAANDVFPNELSLIHI